MAVLYIRDAKGNFISIPTIKGADGAPGKDGVNGQDGEDGRTPEKGVDYFTEADKAELVNSVVTALPVYNGEVV